MNPLISFQLARGITQAKLAELLDMPQSQVSRLSTGKRQPRLETILRIERATGITAGEWAEWAGAMEAGAA